MRAVNPADYYHLQDRKTLDNLRQIPGFTMALKAFMKIFNEKMIHGMNMANKIRLGSGQLPEIYGLLPPICEVLGVDEPEFYLEMNPMPNAYVMGDSIIAVTVTSGLLEHMETDELQAVLAHECGHIACHHVLYHTMGNVLLKAGTDLLGLGALALPLKLAFFHWLRCSEFSCDRAAAIYMHGSESVCETMVRLAGGKADLTGKIDMQLYMEQAAEYEMMLHNSSWDKTLQFIALMQNTHPFLSVRASEVTKWCGTEKFQSILHSLDTGEEAACSNCGGHIDPQWRFCRFCGKPVNQEGSDV